MEIKKTIITEYKQYLSQENLIDILKKWFRDDLSREDVDIDVIFDVGEYYLRGVDIKAIIKIEATIKEDK